MENSTRFAPSRRLDAIFHGRMAMDLYAQQLGARLEDATSFARYYGGSSANQAFGTSRLGLKSAMLARVGDDHPGRFLVETLAREGCDVSHVKVDRERLTGLVLLGIKDRDTFPLIFYRENCADMAVSPGEVDEAFIASAKAFAITGTHLSRPHTAATCRHALALARSNDVRTVLDIDYRPVLWGLTGKADGENRYVADQGVSQHLKAILGEFDLIIGTEEEFRIAGGSDDIEEALRGVRAHSKALLVVKRGANGCAVVEGAIPDSLDAAPNFAGFPVEVMNVLGAGDAFASGFLYGWIRGEPIDACARYANACGALVVSRHGCAPAMPTRPELDYFLANAERLVPRPGEDRGLTRLHRVSAPRVHWDPVFVLAFDHRRQFFEVAQEAGADESRLPALKRLLVDAVAKVEKERALSGRIGVLIDDVYGADALDAATGRGWWIGRPVEQPGSNPLVFQHGRSIGTELVRWPAEHVIKCLVYYHPDDATEHRLEQEAQVKALYDAAQISGHELLLEVIPPRQGANGEDIIVRTLKRFYNLGVFPEWWKLEALSPVQWRAVDALLEERDPYCHGVLVLGLNAPLPELKASLGDAREARSCRGFAVGRTLWADAARGWLSRAIGDAALVAQVADNFAELVDAWPKRQPAPRTGTY
ncbi:MAG TPA: 5-dehydro-2-deoxygluconokinase [Burkholderiales bacterium]|nr:5-dehydro-2-deoxygluconokinase [Burkholderiales bacterium]